MISTLGLSEACRNSVALDTLQLIVKLEADPTLLFAILKTFMNHMSGLLSAETSLTLK